MTVRQEADPLGHQGVIQLLDGCKPRIRVARQDLDTIKSNFRQQFITLIAILFMRVSRALTWWALAFL